MRAFQFWVLLLGSIFVSILMIKQISLTKALYAEQRLLVDNQETASTGAAYQSTWKQLAVHIYQASKQDPALADVLKTERVMISAAPPAPATNAPPASSKAPSPKTPSSTTPGHPFGP